MNLYVRYFDHECVVKSVDEALDFLNGIGEIKIENNVHNRISSFLNSSSLYPFRLKVSYSNYVLFLKTEAETIEQFKEEEAMRKEQKSEGHAQSAQDRKRVIIEALNEPMPGWWETCLLFKRVVPAENGKFQYVDTRFRVKLKAISAMDAYNRVIDHLKSREDIDARSQFPSAKSANFEYKFLEPIDPAV